MKKTLLIFLLIILLAAFVLIAVLRGGLNNGDEPISPEETEIATEHFTFNFVGDNTLAGIGYEATTGGNADYPYKNTRQYLDGAEFNFANLECIYSDAPLYSDSLFHFKSPTRNTAILKNAGIHFVTCANNHTLDYGQKGLDDTVAALEGAGIAYGLDGKSTVFTTPHGIKIGIYCGFQYVYEKTVVEEIEALKQQDVDLIICAFHWGVEGSYRPTAIQKSLAHAAIDAGADIVYGSHPHVLQPVEEYGGGFIMYSLANWSFGGNSRPADMDTALVQVDIIRDIDGKISVGGYKLIPCRVSSIASYNDYCPTPFEEGSAEYERVMAKLTGTFTGSDLVVDYSHLRPTEAPEITEEPELTEPVMTQAPPPTQTPDAEIPETPTPVVTE